MIKAKLTGTSGAINSQLDSNEQQLEASLEKSTPQYVGGNGIDIDNGTISNIGVTSINGQTGDLDGFAFTAEIPTKTSQLENDSNYANVNQIPTKTSQLVNDSNYATSDEIPTDYYTQEEVNTLISNVTVDLSDYYTKTESDDKFADKSDVPTKTSQLTNDSQFITNTVSNLTNYYKKTETYTQTEVNNLIGSMSSISFQVVDNLSSTGEANIIYLVPDTQAANNVYDEYIWVNNSWELIGSTSVDLSNYYTKTEADNKFVLSANLADVAISGSYNDLSDKPTIPSKTSDLTNDSNFATISDIPTKTSDLTNDSGFITAEDIPSDTVLSVNSKTGNVVLSASDVGALPDTTTIPTATSQLTNNSGYITNATDGLTNYYNKTEVDNKVSSVYKYKGTVASYDLLPTTGQVVGDVYNVLDGDMNYAWTGESWDALGSSVDLTDYYTKTETDTKLDTKANTSDLATVATSGSYNDLINKPTIPSAITIDSSLSSTSTNPIQNKIVNSALAGKLSSSGGTLKGNINGGVIDTHPEGNGTLLSYYINDLFALLKRGGTCTITNKTTNTTITPNDNLFDATPSYFSFNVNAVTDIVEILIDISTSNTKSYSYNTQFGLGFGSNYWRAKDVKIEVGLVGVINEVTYNAWKTVLNVTNSNNSIHNISSSGAGVNEGGLSDGKWNNIKITLTNFNKTYPRIAQIWTQNYGSKGLANAFVQYTGGTFIGNVNGITPSNDDDSTKFATTEFVKNQGYAKATDLPTKTSDLTNDSEYQTATQVTAAITSAIGTTSNLLGDTEDLS